MFPTGSTRTSNRRLRTAIEYIQTHAHEPLTVVDIARTCDLSVRGVQEMFQRSLGTTPMGYLRDTRLRRTREDLQAAEQHDSVTVRTIAQRWGFHHMGRFSAAYAAQYGEYPRQTLRTARTLPR
ncbi:helix-turn-helix domain-containing protein (plasmid) [Curtobacterium flaccumfaciens]|nr:helix-turn-helix domain-containing protein [Curtobacterium flaccumfaciens]